MAWLSDDERICALWAEHWAGPTLETRAALIEWYLPLVQIEAANVRISRHIDRRDLYQEGVFGLAQAIDRYDPDNQTKSSFETFARFRIHGEMIDAVRLWSWIPRVTRDRLGQIEDTTEHLYYDLGRPPTAKEVADRLGWTERRVRNLRARQRQILPLDKEQEPSGRPLTEIIADPATAPIEDGAVDTDMRRYLRHRCVRLLNVRQRQVLDLYYQDGIIMQEIADRLGITESRVCQVVHAGTARLRELVGEHL